MENSFYEARKTEAERVVPRLLEKIYDSGKRAILLLANQERLELFNNLLWTYSSNIFLPHGVMEDGFIKDQPIFLTLQEENPNKAEILVMDYQLQSFPCPDYMNRFSRIIHIFPYNESEKYRILQSENPGSSYFIQNDKAGWEKLV